MRPPVAVSPTPRAAPGERRVDCRGGSTSGWHEGPWPTNCPLVDVTAVRVLARYVVELSFDDGSVKVIDLEDWLQGQAFAPVRADYDVFCAVAISEDSGTLEFPNGADLSPAALYLTAKPVAPA